MSTLTNLTLRAVDPFDPDALALLREAAIEARRAYFDRIPANAPWPTNAPIPQRGIYLLAFSDGAPAGCGSLYPLDATIGEIRRMYVVPRCRRTGIARRLLQALEEAAAEFGYELLRLETGVRQQAAMRLYEDAGFYRIANFGVQGSDPLSVCFERRIPGTFLAA